MPKANIVFTMAVQLGAFNAVFKVLFFWALLAPFKLFFSRYFQFAFLSGRLISLFYTISF